MIDFELLHKAKMVGMRNSVPEDYNKDFVRPDWFDCSNGNVAAIDCRDLNDTVGYHDAGECACYCGWREDNMIVGEIGK
jgi:hypothetical protein